MNERDYPRCLAGPPGNIWPFLSDAAASSITGGAIYDALIVESALHVGARELVTWNPAHLDRAARGRLGARTP